MSGEERAVINYGGNKTDDLLRLGRKIVTLRKPAPKYDLAAGTPFNADCFDAKTIVPGIVIANDKRKLLEYPEYTFLLDGYGNAQIAAEDLSSWYEGTKPESTMQRIATLPDEIWQNLSEEQQSRLLNLGLDAAMKLTEFRQIFMPSLLHWFLTYGNATYEQWHKWVVRQGLVTEDEIETKTLLDPGTEYFYIDSLFALGRMEAILNSFSPDSVEYRNLVLHEAVAIPFE